MEQLCKRKELLTKRVGATHQTIRVQLIQLCISLHNELWYRAKILSIYKENAVNDIIQYIYTKNSAPLPFTFINDSVPLNHNTHILWETQVRRVVWDLTVFSDTVFLRLPPSSLLFFSLWNLRCYRLQTERETERSRMGPYLFLVKSSSSSFKPTLPL